MERAEIRVHTIDDHFPQEFYNSYLMIEAKIATLLNKTMIFKKRKIKGVLVEVIFAHFT